MTFLNPIMLFALASVAIPILIHLLSRRRSRRVAWAAMRLLITSIQRHQRRLRLEDTLLLLLRCLLLILLAVALARPVWRGEQTARWARSPVTAVLVLDNSASMNCSDGVQSRFDQARQAAQDLLDTLPPRSSAALYVASDIVRGLIPEPTVDLNFVRKMIRQAPLSDRATSLLPAFQQAFATLHRHAGLRKELYVLTDRQATGWKQIAEIRRLLDEQKQQIKTLLVFVGGAEVRDGLATPAADQNLAVTELRLSGSLAPVNQPLRFKAHVTNFGREEARTVPVSLRLGNGPPADQAIIASLPPGSTRSVSLFARLPTAGDHIVTAAVPPDRMPADDTRTIVVPAVAELKVLLVDGDPGGRPPDSEVFYLRHALVPVPAVEADQYFIRTVTVPATQLETARLDEYDVVIFANVGEFTPRTLTALEHHLRRGGAVIFFLGRNVLAHVYNRLLLDNYGFLPARLGPVRSADADSETFFTLQHQHHDHPVVTIWNEPAAGTLASARFYRAFTLTLATDNPAHALAGTPRVIVQFADGSPALVERAWGNGRVVLFASSANTAWNDLPVRPAFVPLLHRLIGALVQKPDRLNITVGESLWLPIRDQFAHNHASVHLPAHASQHQPMQQVEVRAELASPAGIGNGHAMLHFDQTDWSGAYEATLPSNPPVTLRFAAQMDAAESNLQELPPDQLASLSQHATVLALQTGVNLKSALASQQHGTELWWPIAWAVLALAATETVLAQYFSRSK